MVQDLTIGRIARRAGVGKPEVRASAVSFKDRSASIPYDPGATRDDRRIATVRRRGGDASLRPS